MNALNQQNVEGLLAVELPIGETAHRPWELIPPEARTPEMMARIMEIYNATYGRLGLTYANPEELLGRLELMVARDPSGQIVGFMTFSRGGNGLRMGLIAADPAATMGRDSVYGMLRAFGGRGGTYGLVSERVASILNREGVGFMDFAEAQRLMGRSRDSGMANAQRDIANIRAMENYENSPIVRRASERTGRPAGELTMEDLIDQAVLEREIPDTPRARESCFAIVQTIAGERVVVIKLMMGTPVAR